MAVPAGETLTRWQNRRHPERVAGLGLLMGVAMVGIALVWSYVSSPEIQRSWKLAACEERAAAVVMYGDPREQCIQALGLDR